jgi:hypothetical protein
MQRVLAGLSELVHDVARRTPLMARIRTIKPEFWSDDTVTECSLSARLLFIGMWNFADDAGNLDRSHKQIKTRVFPIDNINCEPLIQELLTQGLIVEYSVEGQKYLHIPGFAKHQLINRPSKPVVPPFQESLRTQGTLTEPSMSTHDGGEGKGRDRKGEEGKGMEGKGRDTPAPSDPPPPKTGTGVFSGERSPPEDPQSRRSGSADRRNGDFEAINEGVSKLLATGVYTVEKPSALAQALHVSTHQVQVAIQQLRDRGRLPVGAAA